MIATTDEAFERVEETSALTQGVLLKRKSMLLFGEAASGKSRLLRAMAATHPDLVYVAATSSTRELLLGILAAIPSTAVSPSALSRAKTASLGGLKGLVQGKLEERKWVLILDHIHAPSSTISRLAKELNYYDRTPILFAGRSPHMEDIGGFRSFCFDRSSRLELKAWAPAVALEFARRQAELLYLNAANLEEALHGIAEMSRGYPGRILQMLRMAVDERYRQNGSIKFHVLYIDYSMGSSGVGKRFAS